MPMNWSNIGEQAAYQGIGMLGGNWQAQNQYNRQRRLMGLQHQYQQALNQQGHDLQFDMWNKTNYGAQVKHMLEAGLNPALMYGSAGQGGTTGSQGGGSAAGGQAVGESVMDLQNSLIGRQEDLMRANAEKARADAALAQANARKTAGVDTEYAKQQIEESLARVKDINAAEELKVEQKLKTISEKDLIDTQNALNKLKEGKGVTGSAINDLMNNLGLDPTNNDTDKWIVRGMLIAHFGIDNITKIARMFPKVVEEQIMRWFFYK